MNTNSISHSTTGNTSISQCSICHSDVIETEHVWERELMLTECMHPFHIGCFISRNSENRSIYDRTCEECGVKMVTEKSLMVLNSRLQICMMDQCLSLKEDCLSLHKKYQKLETENLELQKKCKERENECLELRKQLSQQTSVSSNSYPNDIQ